MFSPKADDYSMGDEDDANLSAADGAHKNQLDAMAARLHRDLPRRRGESDAQFEERAMVISRSILREEWDAAERAGDARQDFLRRLSPNGRPGPQSAQALQLFEATQARLAASRQAQTEQRLQSLLRQARSEEAQQRSAEAAVRAAATERARAEAAREEADRAAEVQRRTLAESASSYTDAERAAANAPLWHRSDQSGRCVRTDQDYDVFAANPYDFSAKMEAEGIANTVPGMPITPGTLPVRDLDYQWVAIQALGTLIHYYPTFQRCREFGAGVRASGGKPTPLVQSPLDNGPVAGSPANVPPINPATDNRVAPPPLGYSPRELQIAYLQRWYRISPDTGRCYPSDTERVEFASPALAVHHAHLRGVRTTAQVTLRAGITAARSEMDQEMVEVDFEGYRLRIAYFPSFWHCRTYGARVRPLREQRPIELR